jgi:chromosome partitioning protein
MQVITIAGPKGGCGKTTLVSNLAVHMARQASKVAIIDLNEDQGTITEWWTLRGRPVNPFLYDGDGTLDEMLDGLKADGWQYVFIDGPPLDQDIIEMSVLVADAVLIPVKLAYFDTSLIDSIIGMCQRRKKPHAFVISEHDSRKSYANPNALALAMLDGRAPILKPYISDHPKHRSGQIQGKAGVELDKMLGKEIADVWSAVGKLANGR